MKSVGRRKISAASNTNQAWISRVLTGDSSLNESEVAFGQATRQTSTSRLSKRHDRCCSQPLQEATKTYRNRLCGTFFEVEVASFVDFFADVFVVDFVVAVFEVDGEPASSIRQLCRAAEM